MPSQYLSVIALARSVPDNQAMDVYEIRRQRLHAILKEQFAGNQAQLAGKLERQPDYVSRILKDPGALNHKPIGEKFAALVEEKCGKPKGWLSGIAPAVTLPPGPRPEIAALLQEVERLGKGQIEAVTAFARMIGIARAPTVQTFISGMMANHPMQPDLIAPADNQSNPADDMNKVDALRADNLGAKVGVHHVRAKRD